MPKPPHTPTHSMKPVLTFAAVASASVWSLAQAQTMPTGTLQECAAIGAAADRLACYDRLAGRALPTPPPAEVPIGTSQVAPTGVPIAAGNELKPETSLLSQFWELEDGDKRGTFNLLGYRANYVMPLHHTSRINRSPQSPTQAVVEQPNYRRVEAKFQISLRTKLFQDFLIDGADLWGAYTQQAMWQIWNGQDSKPFRNTDYEPELIYVIRTPKAVQDLPFGWKWRYGMFGLAHQSNGQSDPLSRSWNRVYTAVGFERGDWTVGARFTQRLNEKGETDNNPDLVEYRGRGELQLGWTPGAHTAMLSLRSSFKDVNYGALQFEWTYPLTKERPNGLRWYFQMFRGYGETLTDYNFRQTSYGLGLTFMQF